VSGSALLYTRDLPGGGYVAIEARTQGDGRFHARLLAERRADQARRAGHAPPVIAEAEGDTSYTVFGELYRIASDNAAVARGLLRWKAAREQQQQDVQ
jgi:hypothetical protein